MKSLFLSLLFLFSIEISFSQGLNGEINFNNSYNQFSYDILNINEFSYLAKWEGAVGGFFNPIKISKIDTLENVIWDITYNPLGTESNFIEDMLAGGDSSFYVKSLAQPTCDMLLGCRMVISNYNLNGNVLWTKTFPSYSCWDNTLSNLYLKDDGDLVVNFTDSISSKIYKIDATGNISDSISISKFKLNYVAESMNNVTVGSQVDSLFLFNSSGNLLNQKIFTSEINNLLFKNDTLIILTNDSIYYYNETLQEINKNGFAGFSDFSNLKVIQNSVRFISNATNQQNILKLNLDLTLSSIINIPVSLPTNAIKDFNESHFSTTFEHSLTEFNSIRHRDYSLESSTNNNSNHPDVGVIDIEPTQVWINPYHVTGVYNYKVWADVLIKNYSANIINSCRINHDITMSICTRIVYSEEFTGLNLLPGDSMWVPCGLIHSELNFLSGTDTLYENICVYTSHPNQRADLVISNDEYCESVVVGYVGIEENENELLNIFPNPANDFLIIEFKNSIKKNVEIYSVSGQLLKQEEIISGSPINISTLNSGYYFISIDNSFYPFIIGR